MSLQEEIDSAQPPTPQKKTTLFINKLLRSGKQSYPVFKEILLERGYEDVIALMENTRPDSMYTFTNLCTIMGYIKECLPFKNLMIWKAL